MLSQVPWHIWVDTGGTFTDCVAIGHDGSVRRAKVLSTGALRASLGERLDATHWHIEQVWDACDDLVRGWSIRSLDGDIRGVRVVAFKSDASRICVEDPMNDMEGLAPGSVLEFVSADPAPIVAARIVTGTASGHPLPPIAMRVATTRGTNALLERKGEPVVLCITRGFGDLLYIGNQQRPDLFALNIVRPQPLYEHVIEVHERLDASGVVLEKFDAERFREDAMKVRSVGVKVAAVALMHSYRDPSHEAIAESILRDCGFQHVSCSSDLGMTMRIVPRARTAVVDAYLSPVVSDFLGTIEGHLRGGMLHVMTSAAGLVRSDCCRACETLLSGPAAGVNGAAASAASAGYSRFIAFDMGGTSTDVARFDGDLEYEFEHAVGDAQLISPAVAVQTVAAGGGSICEYRDGRLHVGPRSAGATPGPACYGCDGPLTITDVNLLLGRLIAEQFEIPLDAHASERAFEALLRVIEADGRALPSRDEVLQGLLDLANQRMAGAISQVSVQKGFDPAEYVLLAFGGAGGQHACAVAELLGMKEIVFPPDASLLSALGLGHATVQRFASRQLLCQLRDVIDEIDHIVLELVDEARELLRTEDAEHERSVVRRRIASLSLKGQDTSLMIEFELASELPGRFAAQYVQTYGHSPPDRAVELESLRVVVESARSNVAESIAHHRVRTQGNTAPARVMLGGRWTDVPVHIRVALEPGTRLEGPCIVVERRTSIVVDPGWSGIVGEDGSVSLVREEVGIHVKPARNSATIIVEELFAHRLMDIAQEMGRTLERTAVSTNVKERLDFSCTVLDADGCLVVNAPHMPVHLGAMGLCVRAVREAIALGPGDVALTNHPAYGGSHLPDLTVVTPVYDEASMLVGYVANRAHHAEIGGTRPGSMPPSAKSLAEEGVVLPPMYLVRDGVARVDDVEHLLRCSQYPSRRVEDNLADLSAQLAANRRGVDAIMRLIKELGSHEVARLMQGIRKHAELQTRRAIAAFDDDSYEAMEMLDDGSTIRVRIDVAGDRARIDFTGTSGQHRGNLNATPAIVRSAVMYVLRLLIGRSLPLNEGMMDAVDLVIPAGLLHPNFSKDPTRCPPVVGGNTETSQRVVDTLLKALGLVACSQGTMNNVLFGNGQFGYYETICGGSGAGPGYDGCHAVHTHMTNTRVTDPEVLEHRYPVRLERFSIRRGSGGAGLHRGGDGAIREILFLEQVQISIFSQHREHPPYGMHGGEPGATGRQRLVRSSGTTVQLRGIEACDAMAGDRLIIETPGGGGWGESP